MENKDLFWALEQKTEQKRDSYIKTQLQEMKRVDDEMVDSFKDSEAVKKTRKNYTDTNGSAFEFDMAGLKMELYQSKMESFFKRENEINQATKSTAQQFMEEKKTESWNAFLNMSLGQQQETGYYQTMAQGQKEKDWLKKTAEQYMKEKKAIENKLIAKKKKQEQLNKLKQKTEGQIPGYDRFVADMAFANECEFYDKMKRSGFDTEQGFLATDINKAQRVLSCKVAYYQASAQLQAEKKNGEVPPPPSLNMESELSTKETLNNLKTEISRLELPGEGLEPIGAPDVMLQVLRTIERGKVLKGSLNKVQRENPQMYTQIIGQQEQEILQRLEKSERFFKRKLSLTDAYEKDGGINEEKRVEKTVNDVKEDLLSRMQNAEEYKEKNNKLLKSDPQAYYFHAYIERKNIDSFTADYNQNIEKNVRAFAKAAQDPEVKHRLTHDKFAGKTLREPFFRGAETTYKNFKGFDTMSEEEMVKMFQKMGAGHQDEKKALSTAENKEGMVMFRDAMISHYDYLARKYGTNLDRMPIENLLQIYPELQKDLDTTQVNVSVIEDLESVLNSDNSPHFQLLKKQVLYYNDVMAIAMARVTSYACKQDLEFYKKLPNYTSSKKLEEEIFDGKTYSKKAGVNLSVKVRSAAELQNQKKQ